MRICSDHFLGGKPSEPYDTGHVDWVPSLLLLENSLPLETECLVKSFGFVQQLEIQKNLIQTDNGQDVRSLHLQSDFPMLPAQGVPALTREIVEKGIAKDDNAQHSLAAQCNTVNITHPILVPIPVHTTSISGMSSQQVLRRISPSDEHVMMDIYDAELIPSISEMPSKEPVNCETDVSMLSLPLYDAMSPSRVKFASAAMIEYDPEQVSLQDNCTDGISDGFSDMYTSFPGQHFELVSQDVPAYTNHVSAVKSQERVCDGENITISKNCIGVQTNEKWLRYSAKLKKTHNKILEENRKHQQTIQQLRTKLHTAELSTRYTITSLETDDKKCKYVTGISSGIVLRQLYEAVKNDLPFYEETYREKMFILAFRKIRLNEPFYTLSLIYDMHHSTVADKVFQIIHYAGKMER
ncbi:uncharacterized protein LOC134203526 [Armigeres subalbatus]|uniref:uncharacterized protein LOC134203526 n=1 Tax=Armigeres subalbatus TaxID=124917 RepID=UPI002ED1A638